MGTVLGEDQRQGSVVRRAVPTDQSRVIRLLRNAHAAGSMPFPFSAPHAAALFATQVGLGGRLALVLDVCGQPQGVLMAALSEHPFAPVRVATEVVWWIEPDHRGVAASDMLAAYEAWAVEHGAAFAGMAALEAAPRAGVIYRRRGYMPVETHFIKALQPAKAKPMP